MLSIHYVCILKRIHTYIHQSFGGHYGYHPSSAYGGGERAAHMPPPAQDDAYEDEWWRNPKSASPRLPRTCVFTCMVCWLCVHMYGMLVFDTHFLHGSGECPDPL